MHSHTLTRTHTHTHTHRRGGEGEERRRPGHWGLCGLSFRVIAAAAAVVFVDVHLFSSFVVFVLLVSILGPFGCSRLTPSRAGFGGTE